MLQVLGDRPLTDSLKKRLRPLTQDPQPGLLLHEIYASIQGEGTHVGLPCTFVRLTACHLRCSYCDTREAFGGGRWRPVDEVVDAVTALGPKLCLITGGEPMLQPLVLPLMTALCDLGMEVLLETSGSLPLHEVDARVHRIIDMKCPSSGEVDQNLYDLLGALRPHDEVKFVIGDVADYRWAQKIVQQYKLEGQCPLLFGPVFGALDPKELVEWVIRDRLRVRVQVQLHKYIWSPKTRGV